MVSSRSLVLAASLAYSADASVQASVPSPPNPSTSPFLPPQRNSLARVPPMGWMSWELFRCEDDCAEHPDTCISEALYQGQADALEAEGYVAAGYTGIHADDCWEQKLPARDPNTMELVPNATRFPSGMAALGDYIHAKGATFGLYTAESPTTCGGYPASANSEALDAKTFAKWGVDYMKVDGCGDASYYEGGYRAMGLALVESGRDIVYSCSWPAYIGSDESKKPFAEMIMDGCNLWRNWDDIQCNWGSLNSIIDHWGEWGSVLAPFAGPGHWHDMDMLLIGANCVTEAEERTQMMVWSISASPLIMGNDLRNVSDASRAILLNEHAIAVNQDPLGQMGTRLSTDLGVQLWARNLADGDIAVGLFNNGTAAADLTFSFDRIHLSGPVNVFDIWAEKSLGQFEGNFTAKAVGAHDSAFLRLSAAK